MSGFLLEAKSSLRWLLVWYILAFGTKYIEAWSLRHPLRASWLRRAKTATISFPSSSNATRYEEEESSEFVDLYFMSMALEEAEKAAKRGEVPIGAVIVRQLPNQYTESSKEAQSQVEYQVLSKASNQVEAKRDASAHAELLAMQLAAQRNDKASWRLLNTTLYSTVEPCAMCLAAAQSFRVDRIVYGAPDLRLGAIDTYLNLLDTPHPFHNIREVARGVKQEESAILLKSFFKKQRKKKKRHNCLTKKSILQRIFST